MQDKLSEKAFWDRVAKMRVYAAFDESEYRAVFRRDLGAISFSTVAVDVGCASGVSAALLAASGAQVLGVDISPELVQQATSLWASQFPNLKFEVADAEILPCMGGSVDLIFYGGVLHHFPAVEGVLREAARCLRPGGILIALEPNSRDLLERIEWKIAGWRGKLSPNEFPMDPSETAELLVSLGFKTPEIELIRCDIPFLNQIPILKRFFSRQRGWWLKAPLLRIINQTRSPLSRGNFFVIRAVKDLDDV